MKKQNLFILTALVMGLTACGSNDEPVRHPPAQPREIPSNPSASGFRSTEQWMVSQLQSLYGDVKTNKTAILGTTTLPAGTHKWQTIFDRVRTAAEQCGSYCQIPSFMGYSYLSPMARIDMNRLRNYLNFNALSNVAVTYRNDPGFAGYSLAHTIDQVLNVLSQGYGQMFSSWYGYGFYPIVYTPWYSGSGLNAYLNYGSGGLQVFVGGSFSR